MLEEITARLEYKFTEDRTLYADWAVHAVTCLSIALHDKIGDIRLRKSGQVLDSHQSD